YTLKDKSNILYHEANALYWAKALLQMTYQFIDGAIEGAKVLPPFKIPCLHFVDAGLLFAYSDMLLAPAEGTGQPVKSCSTVSFAYLVEEFIPATSNVSFMKYIHNGNVAPCILLDAKAEEITVFLAFMQHVQYVKTGGQVYISDYQGTGSSLLCNMYLSPTRQWFTFNRSADPYTPICKLLLLYSRQSHPHPL
ncbi:hypothetical protein PISMIDRAFT_104415, partial [Pisolithus microcarpus 441]